MAAKKFVALALCVLIVLSFTLSGCFGETIYMAKSSVIATSGGIPSNGSTASKIGSTDLASSLSIVDTYVDILKTYSFYEALIEQPEIVNLGYSESELRSMTLISRRGEDSLFIDIQVRSENSKNAVVIANCIAQLAPEYISTMLPGAQVVCADKCISATVVD